MYLVTYSSPKRRTDTDVMKLYVASTVSAQ
jgi:hypothetical protein